MRLRGSLIRDVDCVVLSFRYVSWLMSGVAFRDFTMLAHNSCPQISAPSQPKFLPRKRNSKDRDDPGFIIEALRALPLS
jgi:hypothetical protein